MTNQIQFSCQCGKSKWRLRDAAPSKGSRVKCFCKHCQAYLHHLGHPDILDTQGGTEIFQTTPDNLDLSEASEHLACLRLTPKGVHRWYAACCNTPMFNSFGTSKFAFAGCMTAPAGEADFGPMVAEVQAPKGSDIRTYGDLKLMRAFVGRHIRAKLSGRWRQNPFFDIAKNTPIKPVYVLNDAERGKAYAP